MSVGTKEELAEADVLVSELCSLDRDAFRSMALRILRKLFWHSWEPGCPTNTEEAYTEMTRLGLSRDRLAHLDEFARKAEAFLLGDVNRRNVINSAAQYLGWEPRFNPQWLEVAGSGLTSDRKETKYRAIRNKVLQFEKENPQFKRLRTNDPHSTKYKKLLGELILELNESLKSQYGAIDREMVREARKKQNA